MTELQDYLRAAGYGERKAQTELYEHLIKATHQGVISQAGTGTGKSAAVLSAAVHMARETSAQSIVVTPTLTLMNQYLEGDVPVAREAFPDIDFAELRGRAHYWCEQAKASYDVMGLEYEKGCEGSEGGCTYRGWRGCDDGCARGCTEPHENRWVCDYQKAKEAACFAHVVITNADMLIVNDRILAPLEMEIFDLDGSLFVDEAHTLEQKLRDWASRSVFHKNLERFQFAGPSGPRLARWVEKNEKPIAIKDARDFPMQDLIAIATARMPEAKPKDGLTKQRETREACDRILSFMRQPHESAVLHVGFGSLKMDWINVSSSAGELLTRRQFGLVSATVPKTMASSLGVPHAPFIDVGHPFSYAEQAWIGFSQYPGDFRSAQSPNNFEQRVTEVYELIKRANGGALVLFSSFKDMEAVADRLTPMLQGQKRGLGLRVLRQDREGTASDRQALADEFKADGNAVLFGSESYATGFDVKGDALRLVVVWKLPYPPVDPVHNAIRSASYQKYDDMMTVRAVQAIGRLIRTESDRGVVWIADSRARRLLNPNDPLTSHLPQFARL